MKRGWWAALVVTLLLLAGAVAYTQLGIFVVQPIGAVPEGRTLVITRLTSLHFVDSADGFCQREMGYVNLLCRGMVMGKGVDEATIVAQLPYIPWLYSGSTGGRAYDR